MSYDLVSVKPAKDGKKKYVATIKNKDTGREKSIKFGQAGAPDFTKTKDEERKKAYITRHQKNENWTDPSTAGFWSKNLLWNKPTVSASLADIKKKYF